jgi:hypothetical protein
MRGRQRIWDSEGKKEEKKGEMIISIFILKFISVEINSLSKNSIFIAHIELTKLYLLRLFP